MLGCYGRRRHARSGHPLHVPLIAMSRTPLPVHPAPPRASTRPRQALGLSLGIALLLLFVAIRLLAPEAVGDVLSNSVQDFFTLAISVLIETLPFVVLGILLSIVVQVWLPAGFLAAASCRATPCPRRVMHLAARRAAARVRVRQRAARARPDPARVHRRRRR